MKIDGIAPLANVRNRVRQLPCGTVRAPDYMTFSTARRSNENFVIVRWGPDFTERMPQNSTSMQASQNLHH